MTIAARIIATIFALAAESAAAQAPSCAEYPGSASCVPIKGCLQDGTRFEGVVMDVDFPRNAEWSRVSEVELRLEGGERCGLRAYWDGRRSGEFAGSCETGLQSGYGFHGAFELLTPDGGRAVGATPYGRLKARFMVGAAPNDVITNPCAASVS